MTTKLNLLHEYVSKASPYTERNATLLSCLAKIAQVAGINRVKIKSLDIHTKEHTSPANIYCLNFLSSGQGKDKPLREIDALLGNIRKDFYDRETRYKALAREILVNEANQKFGTKEGEKVRYIESKSPRSLPLVVEDGTVEGLTAVREAYQSAQFGSTFLQISEFGDYITSGNGLRRDFLSLIVSIYDHGDSNPKTIKGEKISTEVRGVPSSAILNTSPAGLMQGKNRDILFDFFNRGVARRVLVCYPKQDGSLILPQEPKDIQKQKIKQYRLDTEQLAPQVQESFERLYQQTKTAGEIQAVLSDEQPANIFVFTPEAEDMMDDYHIDTRAKLSNLSLENGEDSGLDAEKNGRSWRARKLAGLIAAFEHPEIKTVDVEDCKTAIEICDLYAGQIEKFYKTKPTEEYEKLYHYLLARCNEWVSTMDIRRQKFVYKDKFSGWFRESLEAVNEMAVEAGYVMETEKEGPMQKYRLVKPQLTSPSAQSEHQVTYSQAQTNNKTETLFYPKSIEYTKMHMVTGADQAWSCAQYSQNKRSNENATGKITMIGIDVDNGMTYIEMIETLKNRQIKALVYTTRNHQKQKDGHPACDRFRVVFPLCKTVELDNEEHKAKIEAVAYVFGIPLDPAARNISRLWFGNPEQQYQYIEGNCIDLESFVITKKKISNFIATGSNNPLDVQRLEEWTIENAKNPGRNNVLFWTLNRLKDKGMKNDEIKQTILQINSKIHDPLKEEELHRTIFKSLK